MNPPRRFRLRWPLTALGVLLIAFVAAHVALNSAWFADRVRARTQQALAKRVGVRLGTNFSIGWFGEVRLGPFEIRDRSGRPLAEADALRVRPALLPLLVGTVEPARVTLAGLTVHSDAKGAAIRALLHRDRAASGPAAEAPRKIPKLVLEDARVRIEREKSSPLELGPFDATLTTRREAGARIVDGTLSVLRGRASLHATWRDGALELAAKARDLPIAHLLPSGDDLPVLVGSGLLDGALEVDTPKDAPAVAHLDASLRELVVAGSRIADEPVGPMQVRYHGALQLDRHAARATLSDSSIFLGPNALEIPFEGSLALRGEPSFDVDIRLGPVDIQQISAALPSQLAPPDAESREPAGDGHGAGRVLLEPPHFNGELRAEVRASGPVRKPDDWSVGVRLDTKDLEKQARASRFALREPFVYRPRDAEGTERTIVVGPKNPSYVPLDALPAIVPAAVITSEDGNFFKHDGFDFDEIRDSIATAAEGQRLRGGSTITQQLVKNLYLSRERTLARKVREALITLELEAALPKERILEVYLNIIEWGPGIYGIGEAARHYFGVDARQLTPKQAVFLATIIPNPVKYSVYFRKGATSKNWDEHMAHLIEKLRERGDLDEAQYEKALADPVVFRAREPASANR